jgi:Uma2 family endonuclease
MTITLAKWSLDDYHRMIEAGVLSDRHLELLKGDIVNMPPEGIPHAYFSATASEYLMRLLSDRALIRSAKPITLPNDSEPEPDIAIVQRLGLEFLKHHPYPQNIFWLIEYSDSTLDKDLGIKAKIYAESGILEYWVVNLRKRQVVIFRDPEDGDYLSKFTMVAGIINPLAFADINVSIEFIVSK